MFVTGELSLTSVRKGVSKKTGNDYCSAKFLDSDAEEFVNFFISDDLYSALKELPKHTSVLATLNLSLNSKYFSLVSIEPIETN